MIVLWPGTFRVSTKLMPPKGRPKAAPSMAVVISTWPYHSPPQPTSALHPHSPWDMTHGAVLCQQAPGCPDHFYNSSHFPWPLPSAAWWADRLHPLGDKDWTQKSLGLSEDWGNGEAPLYTYRVSNWGVYALPASEAIHGAKISFSPVRMRMEK